MVEVGRINQLSDGTTNAEIKRILNLDDQAQEINGTVEVDALRKWWKKTSTIGNVTKKLYRSLDEFEEFIRELEGLD